MGAAGGLAYTALIARLLNPSDAGTVFAAISAIAVTSSIVGMGVPQFALSAFAKESHADQRFRSLPSEARSIACWAGATTTLVILVALAWPIVARVGSIRSNVWGDHFIGRLVLIGGWIQALILVAAAALRGRGQAGISIFLQLTLPSSVLAVAVLIAGSWIDGPQRTLQIYVFVSAGILGLSLIALVWGQHGNSSLWTPQIDAERWLSQGWAAVIASLGGQWHGNIAVVVVAATLGRESAGGLAVAIRVASLSSYVLFGVGAVWVRRFAVPDPEAAMQHFSHSRRASQILGLPVLVVTALVAKPILGVFSEHYVSYVGLVWVLLAGQMVNVAVGPIGQFLLVRDLTREYAVATVVGVVTTLIGLSVAASLGSRPMAALSVASGVAMLNTLAYVFGTRRHLERA